MKYRGAFLQIGRPIGAPTTISLSVVSARTQLKPWTVYRLWSSVETFFRIGDSAVVATTADNPLAAKIDSVFYICGTYTYIAGIVSAGTGTLFVTELGVD